MAERLRGARRPRRGAGRVRLLARAPRCVGYDYYDYVMNRNGSSRPGVTPTSRGSSSSSPRSRSPANGGVAGVLAKLTKVFGPRPTTTGAPAAQGLLPRRDRRITEDLVKSQAQVAEAVFVGWAPAAPHPEDVSMTPRCREVRRRPASGGALRAARDKSYRLPRPPSFNEADLCDKPSNVTAGSRRRRSTRQIPQLQLDYQGRVGAAARGGRPAWSCLVNNCAPLAS